MIEITIKLDTSKVEDAVREAWQREFQIPDYRNNTNRTGWNEIVRQVKAYIETLDFSTYIAAAAKAKISDAVDEVVTSLLKEKVKQRTKEMMRDGTLFPKN